MAPHSTDTYIGTSDHPRVRTDHSHGVREPIAVIGFSFDFPQGITTPDALWQLMEERRSTATSFPKSRMNVDAMYHPDTQRRGQIAVNRGHFLDRDLAVFDAPFFSTSTSDAEIMDPQQRLILESAYKALENAGLPIEKVSGTRTSVYSGVFNNDWQHLQYKDGEKCKTSTALGVQPCLFANRVSWFFNLTGNSANIDTACSSSLVCLDLACRDLLSGSEDMSIVTGGNAIFSPDNMHSLTNMNMLSPDGQSYSFDHRANGYSRGEGFAAVVLKRLSDAIADGDTIRGIIRSTGCNQDGRTSSITLPSAIAQEALIRDTYKKAGLSMEPTRFFEAHGTGTAAGDPIESKALGSAFRKVRTNDDPLWVGALKSNIGHLEGASGIAGVIKTMLVLERAVIPPNTNFEKVNPMIDTEFLKIQFPVESINWPVTGVRRASVNSFGYAGTNAHVVLDDVYHYLAKNGLSARHFTVQNPPSTNSLEQSASETSSRDGDEAERPRLLILSSNDEAGIQRQMKIYAEHFAKSRNTLDDATYLDHLAYTLNSRRSALAWKAAAVLGSVADLPDIDKALTPAIKSCSNPCLGFVFTGQGAQWAGMGRELMAFPTFAQSIQRSETILSNLGCSWRLRDEVFQQTNSRINNPEIAQPSCTALQIALLDLLSTFQVYPTVVVGHSSGEIAAAYSVGAISRECALKLAYYRGNFSVSQDKDASNPQGGMMAVGLSEAAVQPYLRDIATEFGTAGLTVACINSPKSVTISGDLDQITALNAVLDTSKIFARKLAVSVAYHSPHMKKASQDYHELIRNLKPGVAPPRPVAVISSVTGKRIENPELLDSQYWVTNMLSPVRFLDAMNTLLSTSSQRVRHKIDLSHRKYFRVDALVEIGPHSALQGPVNDIVLRQQAAQMRYTSLLIRNNSAANTMLHTLGHLHCLGYPVDLAAVNGLGTNAHKNYTALPDLPSYVFDHSKKYWDESRLSVQYRLNGRRKLDLLGKPVADWNKFEPRWRNSLRVSEMPWVEDHAVNGILIYPGAGMLSMAIEAANQLTESAAGVTGFEITEVHFKQLLNIPRDSAGAETNIVLRPVQNLSQPFSQKSQFRLFCLVSNEWAECCHGYIRAIYQSTGNEVDDGTEDDKEFENITEHALTIQRSCTTAFDSAQFYSSLNRSGLELGPAFHRVTDASCDEQQRVSGKIRVFQWPAQQFPESHVVHPTTLDGILHMGCAGFTKGGERIIPTMVPTFIKTLFISKQGLSFPAAAELHESTWGKQEKHGAELSAFVMNSEKNAVVARFDGMQLTVVAEQWDKSATDTLQTQNLAYHIEHRPEPDLATPEAITSFCNDSLQQHETPFERYVDMLAHKNGGLRILEIDSGSRVFTERLLQILTVYNQNSGDIINPRYLSFCFSASNGDTLDNCKKVLQAHPSVTFISMDIEVSPDEQGVHDKYDIIIAPQAIRNHELSMRHINAISDTRSKLILVGPSEFPSVENSSHGAEDAISKHGYASLGLRLTTTPVNSAPSVAHVYERPANGQKEVTSVCDIQVFVIVDRQSDLQAKNATELASYWKSHGIGHVTIGNLESAIASTENEATIFVVLLELDKPFLYAISETEYGQLRSLFQSTCNIFWATFSGGTQAGNPEYFMIHGLARALRNEYPDLNITIAAYEAQTKMSDRQISSFTELLFAKHIDPKPWILDVEYLEAGESLQIPRVVPAASVTQELRTRSRAQVSKQVLAAESPPLSLAISSPGNFDSLFFMENEPASLQLHGDYIEVKTCAVGMNFKDYLVAMGEAPKSTMGQECAGIVTRAGPDAAFQPGDRVAMIASDLFKTLARGRVAAKIPDNISSTDAAAIPFQFSTAWVALHRLARLEQGETILIHTASGGTGQAAIQIAKSLGATIFVTTGSQEKKNLLINDYEIPEENIFYSRDTSFVKGVKRATNGRGVDVMLCPFSGDLLQASWDCMAPYGRLVDLGNRNILSKEHIPVHSLQNGASFISFDISTWINERLDQFRRDFSTIINLFCEGKLHASLPLRVYDITEVGDVFKAIQNGDSVGKHVFEIRPTSTVSAILNTRPSFQMNPNATYVIAGGLGGIGRATARWMADRGAKNLILLSRFGPRTPQGTVLLDELKLLGVRVEAPACNVTDLAAMTEVFERLTSEMPPIKGVFQMSIVQRDALFDDMSYDDWSLAVNCKTVGSWNLHTILPSGMDFFVILSSVSGLVGLKGQSNYDAGNTYEDAIARYRVNMGEKAISLDLGAMLEDGILAENQNLLNRVLTYGVLEPITRAMFYAILDYYCHPKLPLQTPDTCQLAIGLGVAGGSGLESSGYSRQPMLQPLVLEGERQSAEPSSRHHDGESDNSHERFADSATLDDAADVFIDVVVHKLAQSLATMQDSNSVDRHTPLQMYGVDSLLAIELRNWIVKKFDADVAVSETQGSSTLSTLGMLVAGRSNIAHEKWSLID